MKNSLLGLLLAAILLPAVASAQVSFGLRTGYSIPAGDAYEQSGFGTFKQSDLAKGVVPIQVDASWRFTPALSAGLYYGYGFGQIGTKLSQMCSTPGASCDKPTFLRYGVQAAYALGSTGPVEPWLGLALGLESASFKVKNFVYGFIPPATVLAADLDDTLTGWNAQIEGGADFVVTPALRVGPLLAVGIGQYRVQHVTLSDQGTVAGGGVDTAKTHEWITIGVRGRFDI
jgi:opacity protein-like surface antigen